MTQTQDDAPPSDARGGLRALHFPRTWDELVETGGPDARIAEAERNAGDAEARYWLRRLEEDQKTLDPAEDLGLVCVVNGWVKRLRLRLGVHPSQDEVRAQTPRAPCSPRR